MENKCTRGTTVLFTVTLFLFVPQYLEVSLHTLDFGSCPRIIAKETPLRPTFHDDSKLIVDGLSPISRLPHTAIRLIPVRDSIGSYD